MYKINCYFRCASRKDKNKVVASKHFLQGKIAVDGIMLVLVQETIFTCNEGEVG